MAIKLNYALLTIPIKIEHWKNYLHAAGDNGLARRVSDLQPLPE